MNTQLRLQQEASALQQADARSVDDAHLETLRDSHDKEIASFQVEIFKSQL